MFTPGALPPGRPKLATMPGLTGSTSRALPATRFLSPGRKSSLFATPETLAHNGLVGRSSPSSPTTQSDRDSVDFGFQSLGSANPFLAPAQVAPMKRPTSTRQTEHRASIGMAAGKPSWTILTSVPTDTGCRVTVVIISPSRFGSAIRVADELIWNEIQVLAAEDVHLAGGEICEWHSVGAARLGIHLVHCACEPVGRQPARHTRLL